MTAISAWSPRSRPWRRCTRAGERLPFAIEVIAFGDEEGVRFPSKLTGSRAVAGTFEPQSLDVVDAAGRASRGGAAQLRLRSGGHPRARPPARAGAGLCRGAHRAGAGARGAEAAGRHRHRDQRRQPVPDRGHGRGRPCRHGAHGAAQGRARGRGRDDPRGRAPRRRCAPSRGWSRPWARSRRRRARPTSSPAGPTFTLDIRAPVDADRLKAIEDLVAAFATLAARRHVRVKVEKFYDEPAVDLRSGAGRRRSRRPWRAPAITPHRLPSGAGHDGLAHRRACARSPCCSCAARAASATTRPSRSRPGTPTSRRASCSTSCATSPEPPMPDRRPLWLRDPLAILAEGDAARRHRRRGRADRRAGAGGPAAADAGCRACSTPRRMSCCRA